MAYTFQVNPFSCLPVHSYGTHAPILAGAVAYLDQIDGGGSRPIVEYGSGLYSTPLMLALNRGRRGFRVFENEPAWAELVRNTIGFSPTLVDGLDFPIVRHVGLAFFDNGPTCDDRYPIIERMMALHVDEQPSLMIVHDHPGPARKAKREAILARAKYRAEFTFFTPGTTVFSNLHPIPSFGLPCKQVGASS